MMSNQHWILNLWNEDASLLATYTISRAELETWLQQNQKEALEGAAQLLLLARADKDYSLYSEIEWDFGPPSHIAEVEASRFLEHLDNQEAEWSDDEEVSNETA